MPEILAKPIIRLFVYGTLRQGQRLAFYMQDSKFEGMYYAQGQLMKARNGSIYIDRRAQNVATIGELHYVSFYCLQRINHLEALSGEFPQGYELYVMPVWKLTNRNEYDFDPQKAVLSFYYRRRNTPVKILTGDYSTDFDPVIELKDFLLRNSYQEISSEDIIQYMYNKMSIWEFEF